MATFFPAATTVGARTGTTYVAPSTAVTYAAPRPVVTYGASVPAVTHAAGVPTTTYVAPSPAVTYCAPPAVTNPVANSAPALNAELPADVPAPSADASVQSPPLVEETVPVAAAPTELVEDPAPAVEQVQPISAVPASVTQAPIVYGDEARGPAAPPATTYMGDSSTCGIPMVAPAPAVMVSTPVPVVGANVVSCAVQQPQISAADQFLELPKSVEAARSIQGPTEPQVYEDAPTEAPTELPESAEEACQAPSMMSIPEATECEAYEGVAPAATYDAPAVPHTVPVATNSAAPALTYAA